MLLHRPPKMKNKNKSALALKRVKQKIKLNQTIGKE
jgi:hypothetical protein